MDAIALNSSLAIISSRSPFPCPRYICQHRSPVALLHSPLLYRHPHRGTPGPAAWAELVVALKRSRRGWRIEQGLHGPPWRLKRDANSPPPRGGGKKNSFWACDEAPGSEAFAAAGTDRRKAPQSSHHRDKPYNSNSKRAFSIFAKLEQGANEWAKQVGNVWGKKQAGNELGREALEANFTEVSLSREEASIATEAQEATTVSGYEGTGRLTLVLDREPITGGAFDFRGATLPLSSGPLVATKKIVLVRHGLSTWNAESRIQGSSDLSKLAPEGIAQAERCKESLKNLKFSACYASPISRARTSAEVIWSGRGEPLVFLDSLKEANLLFLEGMKNVDAKEQFPLLYNTWREDPSNFHVDGVYPLVKVWEQAKEAWQEILSAEGDLVLVVTHKSILRALLCTALGMGPERFRAIDINNGGISVFTVNTRGEPMLQCLNMTAHMHVEGVFY